MEYWNIGILGKSKDRRTKKSNHSKVLLLGFPSGIQCYHNYQIIPLKAGLEFTPYLIRGRNDDQ